MSEFIIAQSHALRGDKLMKKVIDILAKIAIIYLVIILIAISAAIISICIYPIVTANSNPDRIENWKLYWHDEFNGKRIKESNWNFQKGGYGWGNNELQYYTDNPKNCYTENGKLIITAVKEDYKNHSYTSARITTKRKVDFLYGRIDINAKLPAGKGLLPAFWLLPCEDIFHDSQKNGEIDLMEMVGSKPRTVYGVTHFYLREKSKFWGKYNNKTELLTDDFHLYSLEWTTNEMKWLIDNKIYFSFDTSKVFTSDYNPFNGKFYLIISLSVGGDWPGNPSGKTVFPSSLEIDYIRYYKSTIFPHYIYTIFSSLKFICKEIAHYLF